jgi:hypothetical protein
MFMRSVSHILRVWSCRADEYCSAACHLRDGEPSVKTPSADVLVGEEDALLAVVVGELKESCVSEVVIIVDEKDEEENGSASIMVRNGCTNGAPPIGTTY